MEAVSTTFFSLRKNFEIYMQLHTYIKFTYRCIHTGRQKGRHTNIQAHIQTDWWTNWMAEKLTDRQTDWQSDRWTAQPADQPTVTYRQNTKLKYIDIKVIRLITTLLKYFHNFVLILARLLIPEITQLSLCCRTCFIIVLSRHFQLH